jgi:TolB-like protein
VNLPVPEKSIAVLPFENFAKRKQNAYFCRWRQGEILTDLAKVADLKGSAAPSVMQYEAGPAQAMAIGWKLGVAQRGRKLRSVENRVRVNVQLVDARTDG